MQRLTWIFAGKIKVFVSLASLLNASTYCSATVRAAALSPEFWIKALRALLANEREWRANHRARDKFTKVVLNNLTLIDIREEKPSSHLAHCLSYSLKCLGSGLCVNLHSLGLTFRDINLKMLTVQASNNSKHLLLFLRFGSQNSSSLLTFSHINSCSSLTLWFQNRGALLSLCFNLNILKV